MATTSGLGIYSETPTTERIVRGLGTALYILMLNNISKTILYLVYPLVVAVVVSQPLVAAAQGAVSGVVIVILLYIVQMLASYLIYLRFVIPIIVNVFLGRPVFGRISGDNSMRRKTFFITLKCAAAMSIQVSDEDSEKAKEFCRIDQAMFQDLLKMGYLNNVFHPSGQTGDFEAAWKDVWENQILPLRTGEITLSDMLKPQNYLSLALMFIKLPQTAIAVTFVIGFFQLVMVCLLWAFLTGSVSLLSVIQVGVFLTFVISMIWYIFHSWQLGSFYALFEQTLELLPESLREKYRDGIRAFGSPEIRIRKVTVQKHYTALVREYLGTMILQETLANVIAIFVVVGITLLIGYLAAAPVMPGLLPWYRDFALGLLIIPLGLIAGYYLIFFILQHIRRIAAPIIAAILGFLLPYGIQYLLTGELTPDLTANPILAILSAGGVLAATTVTSQIRKAIEE